MNKRTGLFLLLWMYGVVSLVSQNVVMLHNEADSVENTIVDSVAMSPLALDTPTMYVIPTIEENESMMKTVVPVRYKSDVRYVRDSLKRTMRIARGAMHDNLRSMRDSVRNNLSVMARKHPHQVRIGWGDQLFESLMWRNQPYPTLYPESYIGQYNEEYRYLQHYLAEYQYRVRYWFNVGAMVDYSGVLWDKVERNGQGKELSREKNCNFHNIAILLTVRFSYMHTKYVSLYSGLGAGVNINTGTDIDYHGRTTAVAPALNLTVLGMSVGNERWYGAVEFGGMYSLMNVYEVYMAGSRMFTASVGYRF